MEFGSYFTGSYLEEESLTAFWPYPATSSGDFSINNPTVGSFPGTQIIQKILNLGGQNDFTLFMTMESGVIASPSEYQFRTQILASNANITGWDFGVLASNSFFISSPSGEIYIFDDIKLGRKNCFCLKRSGQFFTVFKYDIFSQDIEAEQTVSFSSNIDLNSGGSILIGYNANSDIGAYHYSWYGSVDQLALINEPLDRSTIKSLFAGFEPVTYNISTTYSNYLFDYVWRPENLDGQYTGLVGPLINNVRNYVVSLSSGKRVASFSGNVGAIFSGSGYFVSGVDSCYGSGLSNLFSYSSPSGVTGSMSGDSWSVTDFIRSNYYAVGVDGSQINEVLITHNFSVSTTSGQLIRFDYDELYRMAYPTYSTGVTRDTGYYTGFYMDGVSQKNFYNNSILLGHIPAVPPTGLNILGKFDQVSGLFTVLQESGNYYYNGIRVSPSGVIKNQEYIDVISVTEVDSDSLIYDLHSGLNLMYFGLEGYATGRFFPRTAIPFTGETSYTPFYRNLPTNYYETSKLNMFHAQPVLYKDEDNEFNNMEDYWE